MVSTIASHLPNTSVQATAATSSVHEWWFPLLLSLIAGASTSLGAAIVFCFSPSAIQKSMSFSLSLAASVMITVSVISIGPEASKGVMEWENNILVIDALLAIQRMAYFLAGCLAYWCLSRLLAKLPGPDKVLSSTIHASVREKDEEDVQQLLHAPPETQTQCNASKPNGRSGKSNESRLRRNASYSISLQKSSSREIAEWSDSQCNNSSIEPVESALFVDIEFDNKPTLSSEKDNQSKLWRVAMMLFASLMLHNFPEGLAVVASSVESPALGTTVAIGILVHNIPEGIAIAVPCMTARPNDPWLAFGLASLSGLAEPLGAAVALFVLDSSHHLPLEEILAGVAGIMCMVALLELYPEAVLQANASLFPFQTGWKRYKSILSGTLVGAVLMIATECYF